MVASKGDPLMAPIAFDLQYPKSRFVQCGTTEVAYACYFPLTTSGTYPVELARGRSCLGRTPFEPIPEPRKSAPSEEFWTPESVFNWRKCENSR